MNYIVLLKSRVLMRCSSRGFETASPVNADIHNDGAGLHLADHFFRYYYRGNTIDRLKRPYRHIGIFQFITQLTRIDHRGKQTTANIILQAHEPVNGIIKYFYGSSKAQCGPGCKLSYHTSANNHNLGWRHARYPS